MVPAFDAKPHAVASKHFGAMQSFLIAQRFLSREVILSAVKNLVFQDGEDVKTSLCCQTRLHHGRSWSKTLKQTPG